MTESPIYITVVGTNHYFGPDIFKIGQTIKLTKDYNNPHDDEAISIEIEAVGKTGYVANSTYTVARGTRSAGRIYDNFAETCYGKVKFIVKDHVIAEVLK